MLQILQLVMYQAKMMKHHVTTLYILQANNWWIQKLTTLLPKKKKKTMGMIYYVQKFQHYLLGYPFVFHVDHDALKYLIIKPQLIGHIAKLVILLQEFKYKTMLRPRKKHANIYHLSILNIQVGKTPIYDFLPYTILFMVDVVTKEYVDIFNYYFYINSPMVFPQKKEKKLIQKTSPYIAIRETLYKLEKDGLL